jgi:hypothetical protein
LLSLSDLLSAELIVRRPVALAVFAANSFPNCNCLAGCVTIGGVGGRLVKYARYYWLLLAESHLTRPVRKHAAADSGFAAAGRIGAAAR